MDREIFCETCGNDMGRGLSVCPFCGTPQDPIATDGAAAARVDVVTVNLEAGRPVVEVAMRRFQERLDQARREQTRALVLIHGYGSGGTGGAIRDALRQRLDGLLHEKKIAQWLPGETFVKGNRQAAFLMRRFAALGRDRTLRGNKGISIVALS